MPASPIRKLVPYAEEAKSRGIEVLHLNIGQPDIKTPPEALAAVRNSTMTTVEYTHSAGNASLRKEMAKYFRRKDIEVDWEQIMITVGGSEAINFAFYSILNYGDEVIVPEPFYSNYFGFAMETGATMMPVRSTIETGFALPSAEAFEQAITPRTKAIILCNPNNPTGYVYSQQELEQIRDIILKYDLFLICDEVYREFCYDGEHFSVMNLKGIEQHTILIDSFSKRYSQCGIRIGALVTRNKQVIDTAMKFAQARLSPPTFGQIAAEAALKVGDQYMLDVFNEYKARRDYIIVALNEITGVYAPMPKGAFYAIVHLPVDDSEKFCIWMLQEFNFNGTTVMLAPGNGFYLGKKLGDQQIRIGYVLEIAKLKRAVECLREALRVYPGRLIEQD